MTSRLLAVAAILALQILPAFADETSRPLTIESTPLRLDVGQAQEKGIGRLTFRGSLRLTSPDKDFGGLSGLAVSADRTHFLAISDVSHWVTGTLQYTDGKLTSAGGIEIAPLRDLDGHALVGKGGDAEGLALSDDKIAYVSFERDHRIWRYDMRQNGLNATPQAVATPTELKQAPDNSGLEGITLLGDQRLLALTEDFMDAAGNFHGWLIPTSGRGKIEPLSLKPRGPFKLTDVRPLPNGDILTLERRFSNAGGIGFEIRRIAAKDVAPGAVLDGEVIADAGMTYVIDNMEGLSVNRGPNGETLVYVISDDNFSATLQQTMLMMFELRE